MTGWVVVVVPLLVAAMGWAIWYLPEFLERGREGVRLQQLVFDVAWQRRDWPAMALAVVSIALLLLPILGALLAFWRLGSTFVLLARGRLASRAPYGDTGAGSRPRPTRRPWSRPPTSPTR